MVGPPLRILLGFLRTLNDINLDLGTNYKDVRVRDILTHIRN